MQGKDANQRQGDDTGQAEDTGQIQTIAERILPGWMSEVTAVHFFTKALVPALSEEEAKFLWQGFYERSRALPARTPNLDKFQLNDEEQAHAAEFMALARGLGGSFGEIIDVIKVDLRALLAVQHIVVTERSHDYAALSLGDAAWRNEFLPVVLFPPQIGLRYAIGYPSHSHPCHTTILFDIPSAEFAFLPQGNGTFAVSELPRYVLACAREGTLILRNGYHRSLARIRSVETGEVPTTLLALANFRSGDALAEKELASTHSDLPTALMKDYLTEGLFMDVKMRRKRYQIEVKARWQSVDED